MASTTCDGMGVIRLQKSLIPTFLLMGDSKHTDINIEDENILDEQGSFACVCYTKHGPYVYRGIKDVISSFAPAKKITTLAGLSDCGFDKANGDISWQSIKMPFDKVQEVAKFFRDVYAKYQTEAATVWFYHPGTGEWEYIIPVQVGISHGAVTYVLDSEGDHPKSKKVKHLIEKGTERDDYAEVMIKVKKEHMKLLDQGFMMFGTIHSHCNFSAFHSGVDDADEYGFDGLHITIGHVDTTQDFAQRVIGNTEALTLADISDAVDLGERTIDDLRDVDSLPDMLETYGDRCWDEKVPYIWTPGTNVVSGRHNHGRGFKQGGWNGFDGHDEYYYNPYNHNTVVGAGGYNPATDLNPDYRLGDLVVINSNSVLYDGVVIGLHELSENELNASRYGDTELYWVETSFHDFPVLVDSFDASPVKEKDLPRFPEELIQRSAEVINEALDFGEEDAESLFEEVTDDREFGMCDDTELEGEDVK